MNHPAKRLAAVLLALALPALPVAAQTQSAAGADRWIPSMLDVLGDLVDGLRSIGASSETDPEAQPVGDEGSEVSPRWEPNGSSSHLGTTREVSPRWEPNG